MAKLDQNFRFFFSLIKEKEKQLRNLYLLSL